MGFFRRSDEPTASESFLRSALAAVGITSENIKEAEAAKATDFLKVLDKSESVRAELDAAVKGAAADRDAAKADRDSYVKALESNGFTVEQLSSGDAFRAALEASVKAKAEERAVEISAARGIKPVGQAPAEKSDRPEMAFAAFRALDHEKQNEFIRSGGKILP